MPPSGNAPPPGLPGGPPPPPPGYGGPPPGYGGPPPGYGGPPPGYAGPPPGYGPMQGGPGAPYGVDPATGQPYSEKQKLVAGLLNIFIPGVGRLYAGHIGIGVAQLLTWCILVGAVWSLIDGILILVNGGTDGDGRPLRPN